MEIDSDFWRARRVLVTGHTGFKGAWLSLWLQSLGAQVIGLSPGPPRQPSLYRLARVGEGMAQEHVADVRDGEAVARAVVEGRPEVVIHLAAQPLVRRSLREPALTFEVNLMGTVNVLDAIRRRGESVGAVVVATSDKCYENPGGGRRFTEDDPMGGADPYSSSKACAELAAASYRRSFSRQLARVATARAGNVIGGGDWGEDRLLADAVRAVAEHKPLRLRNPEAVRPWQHVLNPLAGYLLLARALCRGEDVARGWNFGPRECDERTAGWVVQRLVELWEGELGWEPDPGANPPEAGHLALDSRLARGVLGWHPPIGLEKGLALAVRWHRCHALGRDMRAVSLEQIALAA